MSKTLLHVGIDIGSTTVKVIVLDKNQNVLFSDYQRHFADILKTLTQILEQAEEIMKSHDITVMITGSGGMALAKHIDVPFIQEVAAATKVTKLYYPEVDIAIELGGAAAKITYFKDGIEQRLNGTCAGGTGALPDKMASFL